MQKAVHLGIPLTWNLSRKSSSHSFE
ncbi:hypothetical protein GPA_04630 [Gordonibacter pamelaeae 7-10-1-b]|uniref:Uncharacterized protein n=1 Tax=Gordonibacter pamelaeae 7-10-1-b TaxID=657308 RepID=D6E6W0_9ACTN|nr:hypothetical protein GPA_04630 [Gordonibacter pamelaeae 7-10-1-b]